MAIKIGVVVVLTLFTAIVSAITNFSFPDCANGPLKNNTVCDSSADPLDRATALIAAFTLEEKLNNTGNTSPGVPRLGVPPYEWWQEGLHGVAFSYPDGPFTPAGQNFSYATSFPQPILMGAAFDDELIHDVATVISTEARAFSNGLRSGLDFWTPNINPFKDPRWGRGQETPGEDPFHLSSYVHSLIDGLQGGFDPKYKRIVATCKHFAGYDIENWNGNERYGFDALITSQDLSEYYLPPFESCARDSNAGAFMCSYNAVNGVPTCADPYLLQTILREHWGWTKEQQWVVSDCDAVQNIFMPHEYASTPEQAVADALNAGTDINCGTYYQLHLPAALSQGLFNESTLDQALIRQYSSLIRLGYFDDPSSQPLRQISWSDVNTPDAQSLALKAAHEGIVLLKNDGLLPMNLTQNMSIALIGTWANATEQMQGNYFGTAPFLHSPLFAAQQLVGEANVHYSAGIGDPTTNNGFEVFAAANASDVIIIADGIDNSIEDEANDRTTIAWTGAQLDQIFELAAMGKPTIVLQMGGGQLDDRPILNNPNVSAIVWGGYPGQDGGTALFDVVTGKVAPAGRLPITQYPADYVDAVPMTDMNLRPGTNNPGRTYMWYNGSAVREFGFGMHFTNFSAKVADGTLAGRFDIAQLVSACRSANATGGRLDKCAFPGNNKTLDVEVSNTGGTTSDYATLLFVAGTFGPAPHPKKALVAYTRLHDIAPGSSDTARLNLTLGSLARADEQGNKVLYPGDYTLLVDTAPETLSTVNFTLTGNQAVLEEWPQPPSGDVPAGTRLGKGIKGIPERYFVSGFGSVSGERIMD